MQFDRKVIQPDEPADIVGELELPDELSQLAARLQNDAAHLASVYPGGMDASGELRRASRQEKPHTGRSTSRTALQRHWFALGTLASTLLVAVILPGVFRFQSSDREKVSVAKDNPTPKAKTIDQKRVPEVAAIERRDGDSVVAPITNTELTPALLLNNVTGPELEGLLDLLEQDSSHETTLSI